MNNDKRQGPVKLPTKVEFLTKLSTDKTYYNLIKSLPDVEERKRVKAQIENFASTMYDAILPIFSATEQDPNLLSKISEALKTGDGIIKENDGSPFVSGSKG